MGIAEVLIAFPSFVHAVVKEGVLEEGEATVERNGTSIKIRIKDLRKSNNTPAKAITITQTCTFSVDVCLLMDGDMVYLEEKDAMVGVIARYFGYH